MFVSSAPNSAVPHRTTIVRGINHTNPIVKLICKIALTSARSPVGANMAFLRCKYGADFDTSVHTLLNCINVYHELDESHCSILNVLRMILIVWCIVY